MSSKITSMKSFITLILFAITFQFVQAQSYGANLGLRLGNSKISRTLGVTGQYRIDKRLTLEGIIQTDFRHNTTAHILIERHKGFINKRFNAYVGGGLSFGSEQSSETIAESNQIITTFGHKTFGVDAVLGIEMTLLKYTISFDYKPNFNIAGRNEWYRSQMGFSVRSVLLTGAKQNKNRRQRVRAKKKTQREREKVQRQSAPKKDNFLNKLFKKKQ